MARLGSVVFAAGSSSYHTLEEFARDPLLTVACVLLIVVSIAWLVVARRISRSLRRRGGTYDRGRPYSM
jgi:hypothetical protein